VTSSVDVEFNDLADRLAQLVEDAWDAATPDGIPMDDWNDHFLVAGYGRAFRCFDSIRQLCREHRAEDALALTRTLVSITTRSLYLVESDDPVERDHRVQSFKLNYYREARAMLRDLREHGADTEDVDLDGPIAKLETHFAALGRAPDAMKDADVAADVGMGVHYARVYRPGSDASHWGIGAILYSFVELTKGRIPPVTLYRLDPGKAREVLGLAIAIYGEFLLRAENVVKFGLTEQVTRVGAEARARLGAIAAADAVSDA